MNNPKKSFAAFHTSNDMENAIDRLQRKPLMGRDVFVVEDSQEKELERMKEQKGIQTGNRPGGRDPPRNGFLRGKPVSSTFT